MEQAAAGEDIEINLNTIILAGLERGLTVQDLRRLQLGQVVDFVIEYNERQKRSERHSERKRAVKHYRLATKEETDMMLRS